MAQFTLGNFTGLFEVGIALNLSYTLFTQVREACFKNLSIELEEIWKQLKISVEDSIQLGHSKNIIHNKISEFDKKIKSQIKIFTRITLFFAVFCVIGLFICSLKGDSQLDSDSFSGIVFLILSLILTISPMFCLTTYVYIRYRLKHKALTKEAKSHMELMTQDLNSVRRKFKL